MEGTVQRVRPKLMTVATMLIGLVPLLWATGSGADVMKRIAAPMVGGLITRAFLTLEIIPVIYTYWRHEQLLWERLATRPEGLPPGLRIGSMLVSVGCAALVAIAVSWVYVTPPPGFRLAAAIAAGLTIAVGGAWYLSARRPAARWVWPVEAAAR